MKSDPDIIVIGGGLAGVMNAILLSRKGYSVLLFEKETWPFHKVCGEYISNEVKDLLIYAGVDPLSAGASAINSLRVSSVTGKQFRYKLDTGGFGISRYKLDHDLSLIAAENGTHVQNSKVVSVKFSDNTFEVKDSSGNTFHSAIVIGAYGKRAMLDRSLNRDFIYDQTGYTAVKYHLLADYPTDEIGLDMFPGGYCGIVKIEDEKYNLCYLVKRNKRFSSIDEIESQLLKTNPVLKNLLSGSKIIDGTRKVISEVSFRRKSLIEDHIFMCGDTAGLIAPLCGNGMAVALHSAWILSNLIVKYFNPGGFPDLNSRLKLESEYTRNWNKEFSRRMYAGRILQNLSLNSFLSSMMLNSMHYFPALERKIISATHGNKVLVPQDAFAVRPWE